MNHDNQAFDFEVERRRAAVARDYTTPAVIALVLYFVFWIPGFIANLVYWSHASRDQALTGHPPQGKGCLLALLIGGLGVGLLAGTCIFLPFFFAIVGSAGSSA